MRYRINIILCLIILLVFPCAGSGRDYTPVDQLGRGSVSPVPRPARPAQKQSSSAASRSKSASASSSGESRSYITDSGRIKLFGTVELQRPLNTLPGWLDVIKRNAEDPIFIAEKHFNKSTTWAALRQKAEGKPRMEQLRIINNFWNGWPYREDSSNWGKQDYWAIPAQFLRNSGDCEDYAIVKYFTLKELGFNPSDMRIVVLKDTMRNLAHAVLAVYLNNDVFILDNISNVVLSHKRLGNYSPQYSVNESGRWMHMKGSK